MINLLFSVASKLYGKNKALGGIVFKVNKLFVNLLYPWVQALNSQKGVDENSEIIVSLTTFPDRIRYVWMTIASLLNQTLKPCKVVLWLAEEQFPDKNLPRQLTELCKRGLEIRYCDDLKPHKKYFYTMQEWPEKYVLTCDDDMFYPENLIENLWKTAKQHPERIICNNSMQVTYDEKGDFIRRDQWIHENREMDGLQVCPVGCDGVLYPPGALNEAAFDKEALMETALRQDDVWLKGMGVLNETAAYNKGMYHHDFFNNMFTQKSGLWKTNIVCEEEQYSPNEIAWMKMIERYPKIEELLKKDCKEEKMNE